jgi:hypothetical protein
MSPRPFPRASSRGGRFADVSRVCSNASSPPVVADPTLLDVLRELSPEERLRWNDRAATTALELRNAFAAAQPHDAAGAAGGERD